VFASQDWINWVKDENYRRELVLRGETFANVFLSYRRNFRDSQQHQRQHQSHLQPQPPQPPQPHIQPEANPAKDVISLPLTDTAPVTSVVEPDNGNTDDNTSFEIHNDDMTMV
jgi:hypothetical protein